MALRVVSSHPSTLNYRLRQKPRPRAGHQLEGGFRAHHLCEPAAPRVEFHDSYLCTGNLGELDHGKSNWTRADDQSTFTFLQPAPADSMSTDPEGFDQRQLIERKRAGFVKKVEPYGQKALHATINVDTEKAKLLATIGATAKTRSARAAINVRIDGTAVADSEPVSIVWNLDDLSREFVPQYTRVGVDGIRPASAWKSLPQTPTRRMRMMASPGTLEGRST